MFRNLIILLLISISSSALLSQAADMAVMLVETEDTEALIESYISNYVEEGKLPGGVFMAAKNGKVIFQKAIGDNNEGDPYELDDIFRIASMTKAITSVGIMQLYEQGKLNLDDEVSKYIPAFKTTEVLADFNAIDSSFTTVALSSPLTIRNLLTHTSGIYYGDFVRGNLKGISGKLGLLGVGLSGEETTEELVNRIATQPLAHQPSSQWTYGLNMEVLGRVIEVVSGNSLSEYFRINILDPLDMEDTWFYLPKDKHARLTEVHTPIGPNKTMVVPLPLLKFPTWPDRNHYTGGAGLSSTAGDYMNFTQALLNGGEFNEHRILKEETLDLMVSDQLQSIGVEYEGGMAEQTGFSLGFSVVMEDSTGEVPFSDGTFSWSGYFNTKFWIDPELDLVFVGMTQIVPFQYDEFWTGLYKLIYQLTNEE